MIAFYLWAKPHCYYDAVLASHSCTVELLLCDTMCRLRHEYRVHLFGINIRIMAIAEFFHLHLPFFSKAAAIIFLPRYDSIICRESR